MTDRFDALVKREALRRRMRALGVYVVPPPGVLDRIVAEHEAAARLGRPSHDGLCEWGSVIPSHVDRDAAHGLCYCTERRDALERIARRVALDATTSERVTSDQSVTTEREARS